MLNNCFTVDVEDWYQTNDFNIPLEQWPAYPDRVVDNTRRILELLAEHHVQATFFVMGAVAQKYPQLVREIAASGHEIGSHGMWHRLLYSQKPEEFRTEVLYAKKMLEDISGQEITFFRAPSWSISPTTLWALEILEEAGFCCDSSIQPFVTPLSGFSGAPCSPFYPVIGGRKLGLLEFPPTVYQLFSVFRIPFSGGFYLRLIPGPLINWALQQVNRKRQGMVYVHPWEIDPAQPQLAAPPHIRLVHYLNLSTTQEKIRQILQKHTFTTLGKLIRGNDFPCAVLDKK